MQRRSWGPIGGLFLLAALLCTAMPASGQAVGTITGRVVNAQTLEPIGLAQVQVEGLQLGVLTATDGTFRLERVPAGTHTVTASIIGFDDVSIEVNLAADGTAELSFALEQQALALDELVVVGYQTQTRATLTGAVSAVSGEDVSRTSSTVATDALVGKVAGLTTRIGTTDAGDARPGSSTILQVRNLGRPLVVIDGVPQDYIETPGSLGGARHGNEYLNPLDNLNPEDIESITVLKDAAAAVYGFRGADGVILVTTKSGNQNQAPTLSIDGYYGWQNFTRFGYNPPANAFEFQRAWLQSEQNLGQPRSLTPQELENWRIGAPGYESFNHYDIVINNPNAPQYSVNANIQGGTGNATYYFSLGRVSQDYLQKGHNFNRTTLASSVRTQLRDNIAVGARLNLGIENRDNIAILGRENVVINMTQAISSSYPMDNPYANSNPNYINGDVRFLTRLGSTHRRDIAGWQEDVRKNVVANLFAEYTFPFGTQLTGTYSHSTRNNAFERHIFRYDAYCYDAATDTYNVCDGFYGDQRDKDRREYVQRVAQLQLNHREQFGAHSLSGVLTLEATGSEDDIFAVTARPSTNNNPLIDFANATAMSNDWGRTARQSVIGRLDYNYNEKYLIDTFARYDGSYLYASGKRWGFFPGLSVAWRVTEEPFMRDRFPFLNELKIRGSWGKTGREEGVDPWAFLEGATYGVGRGYLFDGEVITGVRPRGLPVTNLTWVESTARNLGIDFVLFDKLSGQADIFERRLDGLPAARYDVLIPNEVGFTLPDENLESEATLGFEAMLTYRDQIGPVSFSLAPHLTVARPKILDRYRPRYANSWDRYRNATENRWQEVEFGYEVIGQFQTIEEIEDHPVDIDGQGNRTLLPGDLIFKDTNGDKVIDELDQRPIGYSQNINPLMMYGMSSTARWGSISLALDLAGGAMYSFYRNFELRNPFQANHNGPQWFLTDVWHREDPFDDRSRWIPGRYPAIRRGLTNHPNLNNNLGGDSDFWKVNIKYLRVRRIQLTYDVPAPFTAPLGMQRLSVYTSLANPYSFDNVGHMKLDPEIRNQAGMMYPTQRVLNIGFDASF